MVIMITVMLKQEFDEAHYFKLFQFTVIRPNGFIQGPWQSFPPGAHMAWPSIWGTWLSTLKEEKECCQILLWKKCSTFYWVTVFKIYYWKLVFLCTFGASQKIFEEKSQNICHITQSPCKSWPDSWKYMYIKVCCWKYYDEVHKIFLKCPTEVEKLSVISFAN